MHYSAKKNKQAKDKDENCEVILMQHAMFQFQVLIGIKTPVLINYWKH